MHDIRYANMLLSTNCIEYHKEYFPITNVLDRPFIYKRISCNFYMHVQTLYTLEALLSL